MQHIRSDSHMFSTMDINEMMKQIEATHAPDGRKVVDVKPLLHIIGTIFRHAALTIPGINVQTTQAQLYALDDIALQDGFNDILKLLAHTKSRISSEISCKCWGVGDHGHATALAVFNTLSSYSWDAKVVIALAAFAVNYGKFWLVSQLHPTNPLAKSVAILKQLPDILEPADTLNLNHEALRNLTKAMLGVTKCIVEFNELPSYYITPDMPELMLTATTHIPTAIYWTIRSIVASASQIMRHQYIASTTETRETEELLSLAHQISNFHSHFMNQLALFYEHIDDKRRVYERLVRFINSPHIENMEILKALIYAKENQLPLFDGSTKKKVGIDILRGKNVLLFISDLNLSYEDLKVVIQMYQEYSQYDPTSQNKVVWLPVVDWSTPWNEVKQKHFETQQGLMPWYSVYHPSLLDPVVIKFIKDVWRFDKIPRLVVLDPQGRVSEPDELHMLWIRGSLNLYFTSLTVEDIWMEDTWSLLLLMGNTEHLIFDWISDNKHICLYGGEDMEWIRKFTTTIQAVALAAKIQLEMLYVGKSNPGKKVQKNTTTIIEENLSHTLPDLTRIRFFWVRLQSMWYSKVKLGKSLKNNTVLRDIMTMLSFDDNNQGWAVISEESVSSEEQAEMAKAKGDTFLEILTQYDHWNDLVAKKGFVPALLHELHTPHHCNRLTFPETIGRVVKTMVCPECDNPMEKFDIYLCCTDEAK